MTKAFLYHPYIGMNLQRKIGLISTVRRVLHAVVCTVVGQNTPDWSISVIQYVLSEKQRSSKLSVSRF